MTEEKEELHARLYDGLLRKVLWGEDRDEMIRTLEVNGVSPADADRLYRKAVSERVSAIRSVYWKRIFIGLLLFAVGCASLWFVYYMTEGFTVWSVQAILIPSAPAGLGAWKLLNGLVGVLTAHTRTGSVSDID